MATHKFNFTASLERLIEIVITSPKSTKGTALNERKKSVSESFEDSEDPRPPSAGGENSMTPAPRR